MGLLENLGKAIINDMSGKVEKINSDYEYYSEYYAECSDAKLQSEIRRGKNGDFNSSLGRKKALIEAGQNRGFLR